MPFWIVFPLATDTLLLMHVCNQEQLSRDNPQAEVSVFIGLRTKTLTEDTRSALDSLGFKLASTHEAPAERNAIITGTIRRGMIAALRALPDVDEAAESQGVTLY